MASPVTLDSLSLARLAATDRAGAEARGLAMPAEGKPVAGPRESLEDLRAAANRFEALFMERVLEAGRRSELAESLLNNEGAKTFQTLLDREYAGLVADTSSLGIAEALVDQLGGAIADRNRG